jgi:hypothetical protein
MRAEPGRWAWADDDNDYDYDKDNNYEGYDDGGGAAAGPSFASIPGSPLSATHSPPATDIPRSLALSLSLARARAHHFDRRGGATAPLYRASSSAAVSVAVAVVVVVVIVVVVLVVVLIIVIVIVIAAATAAASTVKVVPRVARRFRLPTEVRPPFVVMLAGSSRARLQERRQFRESRRSSACRVCAT